MNEGLGELRVSQTLFYIYVSTKKYTKIYDVSYEKLAMFYIDKFFEGGGRMGLVFKG